MQDQANPLGAFLAAQQAEGRYFDTASFTIDSVKALQKLSLHQLPDSGLWLVKLAQAAVASGAGSIEVTFGRKLVKVAFQPERTWQADELLETVLSGTLPQDRALMHLVTGIRASSAAITEAVAWSCGRARVDLSVDSCQITDQPEDPRFLFATTRPSRSRSLSHTLTSSVTDLVKQTVEEHNALRERCWTCPISITVDGTVMPRGYDVPNAGYIERSAMGLLGSYERNQQSRFLDICLGVMPVCQPELGTALPYFVGASGFLSAIDGPPRDDASCGEIELEVEVNKPVFRQQTFLRWKCPAGPVHGVMALASGRGAREPKLHFVLDGAVVAVHPMEAWKVVVTGFMAKLFGQRTELGLRSIVGVEPSALDLSQFAIRELDLQRYASLLSPYAETLLETVEQRLGDFYFVPMARKVAPVLGVGVGAQVAFITAVSNGVAFLPAVGMVAVVAALNTAAWRSQLKKSLQSLRQAVSGVQVS